MTNNRCLLLLVLEKQVVALEEKEEGKSGREREFWDTDPNNPDPVKAVHAVLRWPVDNS